MIRPIFTELVVFLTPFAVYALFLLLSRQGMLDARHWGPSRLAWLVIVALLLTLLSFLLLAELTGAPPGSTYTPAHVDKEGDFVPGRTK